MAIQSDAVGLHPHPMDAGARLMTCGYKCQECGKIAFTMEERPVAGQRVDPAKVFLPDGSNPDPHSHIRCPHCNMFPGMTSELFVEEVTDSNQAED